jgi:very-short-patch-repair endonuclease
MTNVLRKMMAAAAQDGVISMEQLRAVGMGRGAIEHGLRTGWLRSRHRGVYLVGPVAGPLAREHAALVACGPNAVVSDRSAAAAWRLVARDAEPVHITITAGHRRPQPGIVVHHSRLEAADVHGIRRLRLTSPARTLVDLAAVAPAPEVERAINEAEVLRLATPAQVRAVLDGISRARGAALLRELLDDLPFPTQSELERRMSGLLRRAGLPLPRAQARVLRYTVDFLWERERVIVEVDGFGAHGTRMRFETDRSRDASLVAAGYRVLRFTWRQLVKEPEIVIARLAAVLAHVDFERSRATSRTLPSSQLGNVQVDAARRS